MTKTVIAITQNEVARLPKNSNLTLVTDGLMCCIGVVLRGPKGFALMHFTQNTDPNSIIEEMIKLGERTTVKLFKLARGNGDTEEQIIDYLERRGFYNQLQLPVIPLDPYHKLPCGFLAVNALREGEPEQNIIKILMARNNLDSDIDFGPQDFTMRTYKVILGRFLEPLKNIPAHLIYENNEWRDAFELNSFDLKLVNDFLDVANDSDQLKTNIIKMFDSKEDIFRSRYRHFQKSSFTYLLSCSCYDTTKDDFAEYFLTSLQDLYDYTQETQQSLDSPVTRRNSRQLSA